ncbi:MerR family transcriptional regulator [Streptomyces sp. NPDC012825]|uniref:MerR family transcriptional regulator n=1 Tax=Streptomyces sp. NPDC012825 TaxID=3364851 RepID=UPI00367A8CDB
MTESATYGLTTGTVARRLGVSPTTLRSWDRRYGMGPAARQDGRHRRWAPEDVSMLEEMCRLTASGAPPAEAARIARAARTGAEDPGAAPGGAPGTRARSTEPEPYPDRPEGPYPGGREGAHGNRPEGPRRSRPEERHRDHSEEPHRDRPEAPGPARQPGSGNGLPLGDVRRECRGLARAAVRLDGPALDVLLRDAVADHGLVTAWEEVMAPTLHAVGRKWESSGDRYVEVEHLLSWHVSTALRQVAPAGHGSVADVPPVLLACVPGEQHTLPLEALAAGLSERGLPTRMFGAAVPAEALDAAVRRMGPAAVVLWSQARSTANHALARHVAGSSFGVKGARTRPLLLLAGPGWAGRGPGQGMLRPGGLREALDALSQHAGVRAAPPV